MKKLLVVLAVVAAIAVGAYYFLPAKSDVCKNVIPEDAKAVMTFDGMEMVKQLDFSFSDIFELLNLSSKEDKEDVGIDILSPMYGFVSSDNYVCGVFALKDAEVFEKTITDKNLTVESQRGFKWVYANDILACFDSKKALVMGPVSKAESDGRRSKMVEWMKQGSHEVPMLSSIQDKKGILRVRTNLGALPDTYKKSFNQMYKNVDLSKVFFNLAFNLKEKALVLSSEMESEDKEYTKLVSEWSGYSREIDGKQLQTPYEKPLAFIVFNMDGETLTKKLGDNSKYGMMLSQMNLFCNAGMMLQAIDGNVTVAIDDIVNYVPKFYVTAQVKNKDFMKGAENWGEGLAAMGMQCQQVEGENYMLNISETPIFLGVQNDMLYFASDYNVAKTGEKFSSFKDGSTLKSQVDGKFSYFSIDIDKLKDSPIAKSSDLDESSREILGYFDRLNISVGENKNAEIELTTKQKISDIIKMSIEK